MPVLSNPRHLYGLGTERPYSDREVLCERRTRKAIEDYIVPRLNSPKMIAPIAYMLYQRFMQSMIEDLSAREEEKHSTTAPNLQLIPLPM